LSYKKLFYLVSLFAYISTSSLSFVSANQGSIIISNLSHNISSKGKLLYKIKAKSGTMEDFHSKSLILDSIEVILINQGKPDFRIFADKGKLDTKEKNLELNKNIRAFNDKYKITCNKLFFKNNKKMIYLDGNVKIKSETSLFLSDKGEFDIEEDTLTLTNNVKGFLNEI